MFRAVVFRFAEVVGDRAGESFMHRERGGAAADAVDAEREIENRAKQRQRPDNADPDGCGAGVALVQQGVGGGERGGEKVKAGGQMRPEVGDFFKPVHRGKTLRAAVGR